MCTSACCLQLPAQLEHTSVVGCLLLEDHEGVVSSSLAKCCTPNLSDTPVEALVLPPFVIALVPCTLTPSWEVLVLRLFITVYTSCRSLPYSQLHGFTACIVNACLALNHRSLSCMPEQEKDAQVEARGVPPGPPLWVCGTSLSPCLGRCLNRGWELDCMSKWFVLASCRTCVPGTRQAHDAWRAVEGQLKEYCRQTSEGTLQLSKC